MRNTRFEEYKSSTVDEDLWTLIGPHSSFCLYQYKDEPEFLYLCCVVVDKGYRRKGLGKEILRVAERRAKALHCRSIRLWAKTGKFAYKWYQRHGYVDMGEKYAGGCSWMEKVLKK